MSELIAQASSSTVVVRSPQAEALGRDLAAAGSTVARTDQDTLEVTGRTAAEIGDRARELDISVHGLAPKTASLEEAFMSLTRDAVEYHATEATK